MTLIRPRVAGPRHVHLSSAGVGALAMALLAASGCSGGDDDTSGTHGSAGGTGGSFVASGGSSDTSGGASVASGGSSGASVASGGSSGASGSSSASGGNGGGSGGTMARAGRSAGGKSGAASASGGKMGGAGNAAAGSASSGKSTAADLAKKLGRAPNFLVGMGNDLADNHDQDGAFTLGVTMDIHYAYLVGLPGEGGWPDWNSNGTFVNIISDSADKHGTTPMYDLYGMAAHGEGNASALVDPDYMTKYWQAAKLLFQRLGVFDKPAIVHLEPDFWGFVQQQSGGDPSSVKVLIHDMVSECADQPEDIAGLGHCILELARQYAPKTAVGFHASQWAGTPASMVGFLTAVGAADADFIGIDMLDRDAGCFEAHTDPNCQRTDGPWYWDETNQSSPNFHDYLAYSKLIADGLGKPIIWWQIPFGVPSDTPGGTADHYRDNRVHYIFNHIDEFVNAGGLGVAFGVGAGNQTYVTSDGDQFKNAVTKYFASPMPLP